MHYPPTQLLVCYISGLDVRRLDARSTPFLTELLETRAHSYFKNLPSNELFPTMVTGVDPTVHGVWGVRLERKEGSSVVSRWVDCLPDSFTTSVQCAYHLFYNTFDLPAIPPRRRRHFSITRTKYKRRTQRPEALLSIGGVTTVMGLAGADNALYSFSSSDDPVKTVLPKVCRDGATLEILELYSLDRHQQWNLDQPRETNRFYGVIDDFVRQLHEKCCLHGKVLMILSDHGHEEIRESIDLRDKARNFGLVDDEMDYFIEVSNARFWPRNERARGRLIDCLESLPCGRLLHWKDMADFDVPLSDSSYGELFYYLDPGYIFFPHDFHQPIAQWLLGLRDPMQRSRLKNPRHRGNHGHLPHFDAERSFMLVADNGFEVKTPADHIFDVAPSILGIVGVEPPESMMGQCVFQRRS